jgi:adenylate cyclase class IV
VELDELPHLGCFVEIEGPDEQSVLAVRDRLGLAGPGITKSYLAMLDAHCGGLPEGAEVTFDH